MTESSSSSCFCCAQVLVSKYRLPLKGTSAHWRNDSLWVWRKKCTRGAWNLSHIRDPGSYGDYSVVSEEMGTNFKWLLLAKDEIIWASKRTTMKGLVYATPKYATLAQGLFLSEGNWEPTDAEKAPYPPLNCLKAGWYFPVWRFPSLSY